MTLDERKAAARKAAFAQRKLAHEAGHRGAAGYLSEVLAGYRGVPLSGYMPMRTEIDPLPAMAEAAAHGLVCVPVIRAKAQPLVFSQWEPDCALIDGPFGASVPAVEQLITPEVLIVPLVAFPGPVADWAMAAGSMIARCKGCAPSARPSPSVSPSLRRKTTTCRSNRRISRWT